MVRSRMIMGLLVVGVVSMPVTAGAQVKVPPGNFNAEQPKVPSASANRTSALNTTYERKYQKVIRLLKNDRGLMRDIKATAKRFDIDPIHMIGAIVGEHTYNVDAMDAAQSYYLKAISYIKKDIDFEFDGERVTDFVTRSQFDVCADLKASDDLWICRENVWNAKFRGKTVDGKAFPNDRFSAVFFQPFFAGQTFGIGQLNPLTALMMTDRVAKVTGSGKLSADDGKKVYETIMDPAKTLPYIAASLAHSIDAYKRLAGFDISENPGLTATLYNTGDPEGRARTLAARNKKAKAAGKPQEVPQENYYGWLINEREAELRALLD